MLNYRLLKAIIKTRNLTNAQHYHLESLPLLPIQDSSSAKNIEQKLMNRTSNHTISNINSIVLNCCAFICNVHRHDQRSDQRRPLSSEATQSHEIRIK